MKKATDPRHLARKLAIQTLFEWSFLSDDPLKILDYTKKELCNQDEKEQNTQLSQDAEKLCQFIIQGVTQNRESIDMIVQKSATEWPIEQIPRIDLAILRAAIFELTEKANTPAKVVIDEAVELGKEFGSENSPKFINGVLGAALKEIGQEVEET